MSNAPLVHIDTAAFWDDPYPALAEMRAQNPICFVPELNATLLTNRDDIHTCEKNVGVFSSDQPAGLMNELMGKNMMRSDGDEHREERFVYYPAISPSKVRAFWAAEFERLAESTLADFASTPGNEADLVPTFATVMSGEALKVMTGLTNITAQQMDTYSQHMIDGIANYGGDPEVAARCAAATGALDRAIDERLAVLRLDPDQSLLSVMAQAGMSADRLRANIKLTVSGGQNEPRDAIAGATWALLSHPEQLEMVRSGDVTWLSVFEEYCRWISPIGMSPRRIAQEHTFSGVDFEVDDRVFLMFGSANRDEEHFVDAARFDVSRDTTASLTFGAGPHFCAGAAASRSLVGDVALPRLFEHLPEIMLNENVERVRFGGWAFRGPLHVPVSW